MKRREVTPWGSTPSPDEAEQRRRSASAHRRSIPKAAKEGQAYTDNYRWSWRRQR